MKKIFILNLILIAALLSIYACISSHDYSQSYVIILNRLNVGQEIINEKTDRKGNLVCLSEQQRDTYGSKEKKRRTIRTKMVIPEGEIFPVSYSYESGAGTSYNIEVKDGQIIRTVEKEGESQEAIKPLEPGMLMLDLSAYHTINYWIRNYDTKKGGRQVFQTYVLPAGSVEQLSVVPAGIVIKEQEIEGLQLKNYEIEIGDKVTILLWVDQNNHLYRMFMQGPNVEVLRSDLYERLESKINASQKKKP